MAWDAASLKIDPSRVDHIAELAYKLSTKVEAV
jgi:hypothetical protein